MADEAGELEEVKHVISATDYVYTEEDKALIEGAVLMPQVAQGTGGTAISALILRFHRSLREYYHWEEQKLCIGWTPGHSNVMYCPVTDGAKRAAQPRIVRPFKRAKHKHPVKPL